MMMTIVAGLVPRAVCNSSLPGTSPMNQSTSVMSKGRRRSHTQCLYAPRSVFVLADPAAGGIACRRRQRGARVREQGGRIEFRGRGVGDGVVARQELGAHDRGGAGPADERPRQPLRELA